MGTLKNSKAAVQARGEVMSNSVVTRTRKRLSLFVGSSLAVASVMSIAGAVALAPSAAMAYDECTPTNPPTTQSDGAGGVQDVTLNGAANDSFTCTGTHASIRYPSTSGNLTLTLANGPIVTTGGIAVTATGANTVTLNRNDGTAGAGDPSISSTNGAGIQVTTGTGLIALALTDGDPAGGDAPLAITGTTRGVQLQSGATAGQAINLTFTSGSITATATDGIGVEATTTSVAGGNMVLSLGGGVSGATGVRATMNGTGVLQVQVPGITSTVLGGEVVGTNGAAIRLTPSSSGTLANAATVLVGAGRTVRANNPGGAVIEFTTSAPSRVVSVNNTGIIRSNDTTSAGYDDLIISVAGGGGNSAINNNRSSLFDHGLYGRVSLLNTGTATAANGMGEWHTAGVNTIGGAGSTGTLSTDTSGNARGTIYTNVDGAPTSFVFGDATDTFDNAGRLAVGEGAEAAATLTFSGLETWTNRGHVLFGTNSELVSQFGELVESDEVANDRVAAQGAAFNGTTESSSSGLLLSSSYLVMDVDFSANQMDCTAAVTADCLDLRGGSAVGSTAIRINNAGAGSAERLVLVDVTGAGAATSSATAFTLDPESDGYRTLNGGAALEGGLFLYTLDFDDGQYALTATEFGGRALEVARFGRAATEPWRTATGTWHERQLDLRDAIQEGDADTHTGVWLRLAGNFIEESAFADSAAGVEYEVGADQRTTAVLGGVDLVRLPGNDGALVVGVTAGKLTSTLDFTAGPSELEMDGYSYGAYASILTGRMFFDGIINRTSLDLTLNDMGEVFETSAVSTGFEGEAGYRLIQMGEGGAHIEPLVALSYVRTNVDDLEYGPATASFDANSLRGALGLRLSGVTAWDALTAKFAFTGRLWNEFSGDSETMLSAAFAEAAYVDQAPERLADVGVAVGLSAPGDRLSASLGYGVKFADDYQSTDASVTVRMAW